MPSLPCGCRTTERGRVFDPCPEHTTEMRRPPPRHALPGVQHATAPIGVGCSGCAAQAEEIRRLTRENEDLRKRLQQTTAQAQGLAVRVDKLLAAASPSGG